MNKMDPAQLPESLRPFIPMFEKWGVLGSDTARYALMDIALNDPDEMAELKRWHRLYSQVDHGTFEDWFDGNLSESRERALVYFTEMLMYGELEIEKR